MSPYQRRFPEIVVVLGPDRVLDQEGFRYQDEFVRHKRLDILGDVSRVVRFFRVKCY